MIARHLLVGGAISLGCLSAPALAQNTTEDESWTLQEALGDPEGLKISGSVRVRYETLANQFRPGLDENDDIVAINSRIAVEYDTGPIRIGGELIDARSYDTDAGSSVGTGEVNALELVQAYLGADLGDAFGNGTTSTLDLGRFTLDLGSRRLVGRNNYRNTTNAFTGAKFEFRGASREQLTFFATIPHQRLPDDKASILDNEIEWDREGDDLILYGAFFAQPDVVGAGNNLELYFYGLDEDDRATSATRDRKLFTPGGRIYRNPAAGKLDFEFEFAYQFGEISSGTASTAPTLDVAAQFLHAEIGYRFNAPWQPRIALEYDLASGDDGVGNYNRFDSLYGPRRFDYGPTGIYGALGRNNISSPGVRFEVRPSSRSEAFIFYRAAWLDEASDSFASTRVRDPAGLSGTFGGHQVEARVRYWLIPKAIRLEAGGAVLFNGGFLNTAPNANGFGDPAYAYFSTEFMF